MIQHAGPTTLLYSSSYCSASDSRTRYMLPFRVLHSAVKTAYQRKAQETMSRFLRYSIKKERKAIYWSIMIIITAIC